MQNIKYTTYYDKVLGGWFGKCLGGAAGAPVEGIKGIIEKSMREIMDPNLPNDDLDLQLLWLEQLEKRGPYLTSDNLAKAWINQCWYPFGEYGFFTKNYMRGIKPPLSGSFNNYYFHEGMGCPIRSEIWAMVHPGDPEEAIKFAVYDGILDHIGDSVWAEVFLAALESLCFFNDNIMENIKKALSFVKEDCKFLRCANMVIDEYVKGKSFNDIVKLIQLDYSHPDFTNSIQNLGYTILALLFGDCDLEKTINYALYCGYDTDCTCASAGAVIGIIKGYSNIPEDLKLLLNDRYVCGIDVVRSDDKISTLAKDTCRVGVCISDINGKVKIEKGSSLTDENSEHYYIPFSWEKPNNDICISVEYLSEPGVGYEQGCPVELTIKNNSPKTVEGVVVLEDIPKSLDVSKNNIKITLLPNSSKNIIVDIESVDVDNIFSQTNILTAKLNSDKGELIAHENFGVIGAMVWNIYGPFIEQRFFQENPSLPPCHGDADVSLPPVETIFANMAVPDKEYLDEKQLISNAESFVETRVINSIDDMIDVDKHFGLVGEATFYAATDLVFDEDTAKWVVCGNSDAYKLWINGELVQEVDEYRNWQPQCHGSLVEFKQGANRVIVKLTRRAETLKFNMGIREYNGKHYHGQRFTTDFKSKKI